MSLLNVNYREPNNAFNVSKRHNYTSVAKCPIVKEEEIFANLSRIIMTMKEDPSFLTPGDSKYYEKFRWSFYEPFGIPPYSFTNKCMQSNYKNLFNRFNKSADKNILDDFFNNSPDTCVFDIFEENSVKYGQGKQVSNLFLITNWHLPNTINDELDYKIHFCVKEEYALYALMKAMTIMNNMAKEKTKVTGKEYRSSGKIMTKFEYTKNPFEQYSVIYIIPAVVIYTGTQNKEEVKIIIEEFIKAFPESEEIGTCELGDPQKIPYGNVRLNKLICYAQGDRTMKLEKVRFDIIRKSFDGYTYVKTIPPWIIQMRSKCDSPDEVDKVNKKSQHFFGVNICDAQYEQLTNQCTIQPFCYLSPTTGLLDPTTLNIEKPTEDASGSVPVNRGGRRKRTRRLRKKSRSRRKY